MNDQSEPNCGELAALRSNTVSGTPSYTRESIETAVKRIWESTLGLTLIEHHADFLDIGGDSITATLIAGQVRSLFMVDIPLPFFFEQMSISEMTSMICESPDRINNGGASGDEKQLGKEDRVKESIE